MTVKELRSVLLKCPQDSDVRLVFVTYGTERPIQCEGVPAYIAYRDPDLNDGCKELVIGNTENHQGIELWRDPHV